MRRRLVLLVAAATTTVALAFVVPLALVVAGLAEDRARQPAEQTARGLVPIVALADDEPLVAAALSSAAERIEGTAALFLPDGRVLGEAPAGADAGNITEPAEREVGGDLWLFYPVTSDDGTTVVLVTVPEAARRRGVARSWLTLGALGVLLVAGATLLADRLGRRVTVALEHVEVTAGELIAGRLEARAEIDDPPEVAAVSEALDRLAERVGIMVESERQRAGDLSHRLRTPMTALRLDVDALKDDPARARLSADLDALEATVDQLIEDARRPGREGVRATTDLLEVTHERARFWQALAQDEGRPFQVSLCSDPAFVAVEEADARALLDVLLDNVFTHTEDGAAVRVTLSVEDSTARLSVEDAGPGPVAEPGEGVIRRRGTTGLGLDIARRTTERANGQLMVTTSDLGGTAVVVTLPTSG